MIGNAMNNFAPLILLHENGHKALAKTNHNDNLPLGMEQLKDKMVHVGDGESDVTVGFANRHRRNWGTRS
jgi:hypothetical protein